VLYNAFFNLRQKKSGFSGKSLAGCHFFFELKNSQFIRDIFLNLKINLYLSINHLEEVGSDCKDEFLWKHQQKINHGMNCA
jgi:hypothetical protein